MALSATPPRSAGDWSWRRLASGALFVAAIVRVDAGAQTEIKIRPDAKLIDCLVNYRRAVDEYRHGDRSASIARVGHLDASELRTVVGALSAARRIPSKYASPEQRSADQLAPLLRWDSPSFTAAGVLHLEMSRIASDEGRINDIAFHDGLATVLFTALANPLPGESDRDKRRSTLAVGWHLLFQRKLRSADQHFETAAKQWPRDADIQLAYGAVIETECMGPYPVLTAELLVPPPPPPRSRIEREDVNPYSRERSTRVSMLRGAERVLALAAELDASSIEARVRLAHVRALEHKDADAVAVLEEVLRGSPSKQWQYIANLILGTVHEHGGQRERAKAAYEQALRLQPGGQVASIALSHLALATDDRDAAAAALDRLFEVSPNQRDPWWDYPLGLRTTADALFDKLRSQVRE